MLDDFRWPEVEDKADETIVHNVRKHGCHIVGIWDGEPRYSFSVGLWLNFGQAELVIFGLEGRDAAGVINNVRDCAAAGRGYAAGDVCDDLLVDTRVCFVEVPLRLYDKYLGTAIWFYQKSPRPFPCLQMVWSDGKGRFPWESGYDLSLKQYQPVLRSCS